MRSLYTCIALDFDYCTARFVDKEVGLADIFVRRGVPHDIATKKAWEAVASGFTIEKYITLVSDAVGQIENESTILGEYLQWFTKNLRLYDDSAEAMERMHRMQVPIVFVTFGIQETQMQKIHTVGVRYSDVRVVTPPSVKASIIQELLSAYRAPILYADDKPQDLDMVRDIGLTERDVVTVRVNRLDSPHKTVRARHHHVIAANLMEIPIFA